MTPFTITLRTDLVFRSSFTGGRGTPLFTASIPEGADYLANGSVAGFVIPPNGPSSQRAGTTNFIAVTVDPETGVRRTWVSASVGATGLISGLQADWEHQVRFDSGLPGVTPTRLELGTVPNAGIWTFDALAPTDYTVEFAWNAADILLDPTLSGFAARELLAGRDPAERAASYYADPVDAGSGAQVMQLELLRQHGHFPFSLVVQHHTLLLVDGPLGRGWSHEYEARLDPSASGGPVIAWGGGRRGAFEAIAGEPGAWRGSGIGNRHDRLRSLPGGGWVHERPDGFRHRFAADGSLVRVEARTGDGVDVTYQGGRLDRVTDPVTGHRLEFAHDDAGRLTGVTDGAGRRVTFQHQGDRLVAIDRSVGGNRRPVRATYAYDARARLLSGSVGEVDGGGQLVESFVLFENAYDAAGRISSQWGYGGRARAVGVAFVYAEAENPTRVVTFASRPGYVDARPTVDEVLEMEAGSRPLPQDAELFVHDEQLRLVRKLEDRGGTELLQLLRDTRWEFGEGLDAVRRLSDVLPETSWERDPRGRIITETTATGKVTRWEWSDSGALLGHVDPAGRVTRHAYDAAHRLVSSTDPAGAVTTFTYHADGTLATSTSPTRLVRRFTSTAGLATRIEEPGGATYEHRYDAAGRLVETTGPGGRRWATTWDDLDGATRRELPGGTVLLETFDHREPGRSLRTSRTDANGVVTTFEHRATWRTNGVYRFGNWELARPLSAVEDPLGRTVILRGDELSPIYNGFWGTPRAVLAVHDVPPGYDHPWSQVVGKPLSLLLRLHRDGPEVERFSDSVGANPMQWSSSAADRPYYRTRLADAFTVFDTQGRERKRITRDDVSRPLGGMGFIARDADGRPERLETHSGTVMRRFTHDASDRLVAIEDPERGTTTREFDDAGRLVRVTLPDGTSASRTFDDDGWPTSQTAPSGAVTTFERGPDGRVAAITWPDASRTRLTWNPHGELVGEEFPSGRTVVRGFDARGLPVSETDGDDVTSRTYDASGRLLTVSRGGLVTTREHDARGRLVRYVDSHGREFRFGWDARGRLASLGYPDGSTVAYDGVHGPEGLCLIANPAWGLAIDQSRWLPHPHSLEETSASWSVRSAPDSLVPVVHRGHTWTLTIEQGASRSSRLALGYSIANQSLVQQLARILPEGPAWSPWPTAWSFDDSSTLPALKVLSWRPPAPREITRGPDGRATALDGRPITYDPDGHLLAGPLPDGSDGTYAWDARGRLAEAGGVQYLVDPEDQARGWVDASGTTRFFVAPLFGRTTILGMETPDGETVWFVHGVRGLLAEHGTRRGLRYYAFDPAGNTLWNGTALEHASAFHAPFGEIVAQHGTWATPFRYRGREGVPTAPNGLVWMRARHYHPGLRSFLSPDPDLGRIEMPGTLDRYAYALNQPLAYSDPTGLAPDGILTRDASEGPFRPRRILATVSLVKGTPAPLPDPSTRSNPGLPLRTGDVLFEGESVFSPEGSRIKLAIRSANGVNDVVIGSDTFLNLAPPSPPPTPQPGSNGESLRFRTKMQEWKGGSDVFEVKPSNQVTGVRG